MGNFGVKSPKKMSKMMSDLSFFFNRVFYAILLSQGKCLFLTILKTNFRMLDRKITIFGYQNV